MTDDLMMDKNCRGEVPSPMGWGTQPLQGGMHGSAILSRKRKMEKGKWKNKKITYDGFRMTNKNVRRETEIPSPYGRGQG